jgi:hypothetical protein
MLIILISRKKKAIDTRLKTQGQKNGGRWTRGRQKVGKLAR